MLNFIIMALFSFSSLAAVVIPFERDVQRVQKYKFLSSNNSDSDHFSTEFAGDMDDILYFRGNSILNYGPNEIVPTTPTSYVFASREYSFMNDDRAKNGNYIWITDYNGSGKVSDMMETVLVVLPRLGQTHVEEVGEEIHVTLTNGEEVSFLKKSKTLISGVFQEAPLQYDAKPIRLNYSGEGVIIRSDARGADPRLKKESLIFKGDLPPCTVLTSKFWTQEGFPRFQYVSDEEAFKVIEKSCGKAYLP